MKRSRAAVGKTCALVEALEKRQMLSGVHLFHSMRGPSKAAAARVSLVSGVVAENYASTAKGGGSSVATPIGELATFYSVAGVDAMSATIDWGDGSAPETAMISPTGAQLGVGRQYAIVGAHQYASAGTFSVRIYLAVDVPGGIAYQRVFGLSAVSNPPMVEYYPGGPPYFTGGQVQKAVGVAGDPRFQSFPGGLPSELGQCNFPVSNIVIDWGDGSGPTAGSLWANAVPAYIVVGQPPPQQTYSIVGEHTYAAAGRYDVTITAVDVYGNVWTADSVAIVTANNGRQAST